MQSYIGPAARGARVADAGLPKYPTAASWMLQKETSAGPPKPSLGPPLRTQSPPLSATGGRSRAGGSRGTLDHSLVGPPSGYCKWKPSLDHSLAAPDGWLAHAGKCEDVKFGSRDFGAGNGGETTLDLLVVVVDETLTLPRLRGAPSFHGRIHDLRGLPARHLGDDLVAQCVEGVPVVSRPGGKWCLCWSETVRDENGNHELGTPGPRIEVIEEPELVSGGAAQVLDSWTLAEAGIETDDILWCRHLVLHS